MTVFHELSFPGLAPRHISAGFRVPTPWIFEGECRVLPAPMWALNPAAQMAWFPLVLGP